MSIKKYVCSKIQSTSLNGVYSIEGETINLISGYELESVKINYGEISENLKNKDAGDYVEQIIEFTVDEGQIDPNDFKVPRIFKVTLSDDRIIIFGSIDNPALCVKFSHQGSAFKIQYSREYTWFEFIPSTS